MDNDKEQLLEQFKKTSQKPSKPPLRLTMLILPCRKLAKRNHLHIDQAGELAGRGGARIAWCEVHPDDFLEDVFVVSALG